MPTCPTCQFPLRAGRRICPACRQPVPIAVSTAAAASAAVASPLSVAAATAVSVAAATAVSVGAATAVRSVSEERRVVPAPVSGGGTVGVSEPALGGWQRGLSLRASARRAAEAAAASRARPRGRYLHIGAAAVGIIASLVVIASWIGQSTERPGVGTDTAVSSLPWRSFQSPDEPFTVELPGTPTRITGISTDGNSRYSYQVTVPGAVVTVSVQTPVGRPPEQVASIAPTYRATELGGGASTADVVRVAWGTAYDASFSSATETGWIRATASGAQVYVLDVHTTGGPERARELFGRLATSFRPRR
jgi:hypothetical protein